MAAVLGDSGVVDDAAIDAGLARRVVAGDRTAEGELCRRLVPRIRAWGLKRLRDEAAARDLAQHVMLTVLEALRAGRVEQVERLGPYLFGVCSRSMMSWRGDESRRAALLERNGPVFAEVVEIHDTAIDRRRLEGCFERLTVRARAVLSLSFFAERSSEEIAEELGVTAGNVRVLRHRALAQLHACLEAGR